MYYALDYDEMVYTQSKKDILVLVVVRSDFLFYALQEKIYALGTRCISPAMIPGFHHFGGRIEGAHL